MKRVRPVAACPHRPGRGENGDRRGGAGPVVEHRAGRGRGGRREGPDRRRHLPGAGAARFRLGDIDGRSRDFDKYIELKPGAKISHWQRGISYYYAGRYDDGRRQFEGYQDFDSNDVENAVWRFMCMAREDGIDKARKEMLKIGDDSRVPMRQVYDIFKGDLKPDDVFAAAKAGEPPADATTASSSTPIFTSASITNSLGDQKKAPRAPRTGATEHTASATTCGTWPASTAICWRRKK